MLDWHCFEDRNTLVAALSAHITAALQSAISARGCASLLASGGSTPAPLYRRLSQTVLDWQRVSVALVDERWVAADHPRSNTRFLRETLLQHQAAAATFVPMVPARPEGDPFLQAAETEARYQHVPTPFDMVVLGLGPDGHTASLFPGARGLEDAFAAPLDQRVAAIEARASAVTGDETLRLSLTPVAIAGAAAAVLMITGQEKRRTAEEAVSTGGADLPFARVAALMDRALPVYWAP